MLEIHYTNFTQVYIHVSLDISGPRWASWNLGIFLCIRCAGIHRNLGVHITKVKSVNLDTWTPEQVAVCIFYHKNVHLQGLNLKKNPLSKFREYWQIPLAKSWFLEFISLRNSWYLQNSTISIFPGIWSLT